MAKNEQRLFPTGLCETCFWRFQCGYAVDNPNEHVRTCDNDGGLSYMDDPRIEREKQRERAGLLCAKIARDSNGICRVMVKRAKFKHWFELGQHGPTDAAFEQALAAGTVRWNPVIEDKTKLFRKI